MAPDARSLLARQHVYKRPHPLQFHVVLVERLEIDGFVGRHDEVGGAVFLDRHDAQDAFERERAANGQWFRPAGKVRRFGQLFEHEQLLDVARLDALHVATVVDVLQHNPSCRLRWIDQRR